MELTHKRELTMNSVSLFTSVDKERYDKIKYAQFSETILNI